MNYSNIKYKKNSSSESLVSNFSFNDEDSIELIKKKILMSLPPKNRPASINEMYMYTKTTVKTSTLKVLQTLSNNFSTPVTYQILKHFAKFCKYRHY